MPSTSAYEVGQRVKAVRGPKNTMNPEHYYVGEVGTINHVYPPVDGMPYYGVTFDCGADCIDHCNLEVV